MELVEAVVRREKLIFVAEVILAELARGITLGLEHLGEGRVFGLDADVGAWRAHLGQAGSERTLAGDKGRAARCAALIAVVVGQDHAFVGDPINVRCAVAHHATGIDGDIADADVISPNDEDIGLVCGKRDQRGEAERPHDQTRLHQRHFSLHFIQQQAQTLPQ